MPVMLSPRVCLPSTHICARTRIHTGVHTCTHVFSHTHTKHARAHTRTHMHMYSHVHTHMLSPAHKGRAHTCTQHTLTYVYVHVHHAFDHDSALPPRGRIPLVLRTQGSILSLRFNTLSPSVNSKPEGLGTMLIALSESCLQRGPQKVPPGY